MIKSIDFRDFRVLERATLGLSPFNVLIGPNGSGKTTALRALAACGEVARASVRGADGPVFADLAGARATFSFAGALEGQEVMLVVSDVGAGKLEAAGGGRPTPKVLSWLAGSRDYILDPVALARSLAPDAAPILANNGEGLAAVLAHLERSDPDRWRNLVDEFCRLMPEFSDVLPGQNVDGRLTFSVRTLKGRNLEPHTLSQGTLVLLALLAIVFAPERPTLICVEEIERGFHPRLLREVRDLFYRLSFPEDCGETVPPVQVVATTHSPYVLDLFADTPEDVILATKREGAATFQRLCEIPGIDTLLEEGRLGDLWFSGILGGVP